MRMRMGVVRQLLMNTVQTSGQVAAEVYVSSSMRVDVSSYCPLIGGLHLPIIVFSSTTSRLKWDLNTWS